MASPDQLPLDRKLAAHITRFLDFEGERMAEYAAVSPRIAQLSVSFPLLFALLTQPYGSLDTRMEAVQLTVDGAPLAEIAHAMGLPLSLRHIPPEGCNCRMRHETWSAVANRTLRPCIPDDPATARAWLAGIAFARGFGDETIALWAARQHRLFSHNRTAPSVLMPIILYAWHSRHNRDLLLTCPPWSPAFELRKTFRHSVEWLKHVKLLADLDPEGIADPWLPPATIAGYQIQPLDTAEAIAQEAREMRNCLVEYSGLVSRNVSRLFGLRRDGRHIATLEMRRCPRSGWPTVVQMKGHDNALCPNEIWEVASRYVRRFGSPVETWQLPLEPAVHSRFAALLAPYRDTRAPRDQTWLEGLTLTGLQSNLTTLGRALDETVRWMTC
jgi:hypothetical protein